ncbi:MAG: hypothetical protein ABIQ30_14975 [Devosia sp.]
MSYDFNALEASASKLISDGRPADALKIYFYMASGDPSLDGGYLGWRIGQCYEALGDLHAAAYWHGRAVEENPDVRKDSAEAITRIGELSIDEFIVAKAPVLPTSLAG